MTRKPDQAPAGEPERSCSSPPCYAAEFPGYFGEADAAPVGAGTAIRVTPTDLADPEHVTALLALLDHYARDPMGGGNGLAAYAREHLAARLGALPGFVGFLAWEGEGTARRPRAGLLQADPGGALQQPAGAGELRPLRLPALRVGPGGRASAVSGEEALNGMMRR